MSMFSRFPNELFYLVFEYLTAYDILYAFKGLNKRIDKLCQSYNRYNLDLKSCTKSQFDFIRQSIESEQIRSLILFDSDDTCRQIHLFFKFFDIRKCIHLELLFLVNINEQNLNKIRTKFNLLPKLSHLSIHLQHGLISQIIFPLTLKYLSIRACSIEQLHQILLSVPLVRTLDIQLFANTNSINEILLTTEISQLKLQLPQKSNITFDHIELLFQWMPKLKCLTFIAKKGIRFIHGNQWENLIRRYLSNLKQFHFSIHPNLDHVNLQQILSTFQTSFWLEDKQWFIHCNYSQFSNFHLQSLKNTHFYTLPYCDEEYYLNLSAKRMTTTQKEQYSTVKKLYLSIDCPYNKNIEENYYFPNLNCLTIQNLHRLTSINQLINLSTIQHLTIEQANNIHFQEFLLYILTYTKHLQSLELSWNTLEEITNHFTNQQVCSLLGKQIKRLNLLNMISKDEKENLKSIEILRNIFSEQLETLSLSVLSIDNIIFILNEMFKLNSLKFECNSSLMNNEEISLWLTRNVARLKNSIYQIQSVTETRICLIFWLSS